MKENSKLMYRLGRIFSFVFLGIACGLFVLHMILMIVHIVQEKDFGNDISRMISTSIWIVLLIVLICLATRAMVSIENEPKNNSPHIVMIVFGALTGDIFYILGGIFGLVAIGQDNNNDPKQIEEKKDEE